MHHRFDHNDAERLVPRLHHRDGTLTDQPVQLVIVDGTDEAKAIASFMICAFPCVPVSQAVLARAILGPGDDDAHRRIGTQKLYRCVEDRVDPLSLLERTDEEHHQWISPLGCRG